MEAQVLEREEQLADLHAALAAAGAGHGRVVLVRGEAGIGKTTLVRRFLAEAAATGATLLGSCDDLGTPQPWGPLWDVARDLPPLAAALRAGDRRRIMEAALDALRPDGGTSVLALEDLQWADDASLDVVTQLGRRVRATTGLLLLTYREGEVGDDHPLRRVLGGLPAEVVTRLRPPPLTVDAVRALMADRPRDADHVRRLTGGNPLFVTEVLAAGDERVPGSVRDAVVSRLARLGGDARRLVDLVSVVPGGARWEVLEAILGADGLVTSEGAHEGLLVVGDEVLAFRHELQRRAVEDRLAPPVRRRLHGEVLAALGGRADATRLAYHARHGGDVAALLEHAPRAGREALVARSHREAVEHFRCLEDHLDELTPAEAADVADGWARAAWHVESAGATDAVDRAVALRRGVDDPAALSGTLAFGAFVVALAGRADEAESWLEEAVDLVEDGPATSLAYALTEHARLLMVAADPRAGAVAERAGAVASAAGDVPTELSAEIIAGTVASHAGHAGGQPRIAQALARAEEGGHALQATHALLSLGSSALHELRDPPRAVSMLDRARRAAEDNEFLHTVDFVTGFRAIALLWAGDWTTAETEAEAILASADLAPDAETMARHVLALLATRRGADDAGAVVDRLWAATAPVRLPTYLDAAGAALGEHLWLHGRDASPHADELAAVLAERATGLPLWVADDLFFWGVACGLLDELPAHVDDAHDATLGGRATVAARTWDERGMPYHRAVALLHGDDDELVHAIHLLEDLGATRAARRGRRMARDRGVAVPRGRSRAAREHGAGLTARQAEVLDLLATGATNQEIADDLVISLRTVENHVAAVLRSLDVGDRHAAVEVAAGMGLLDDVPSGPRHR